MSEYTYETAAETAKKIRQALKEAYPDLPARHFSVRSSTYSGGSSISVHWEDYPLEEDVRTITQQYQSASFDGMQDLETTHGYIDPKDGKEYVGAKYIFANCKVSKERQEKIIQYLEENYSDFKRGQEFYPEWFSRYQEANKVLDVNNNVLPKYDKELYKKDLPSLEEDNRDYTKLIGRAIEETLQQLSIKDTEYKRLDLSLIGRVKTFKESGGYFSPVFKEINKDFKESLIEDLSKDKKAQDKIKGHVHRSRHQAEFEEYLPEVLREEVVNLTNEVLRQCRLQILTKYKQANEQLLEELATTTSGTSKLLNELKQESHSVEYTFESVQNELKFNGTDVDEEIEKSIAIKRDEYKPLLEQEEIKKSKENVKDGGNNVTKQEASLPTGKVSNGKWKHVKKRKEFYKYVTTNENVEAMIVYNYLSENIDIVTGVTKTEYNTWSKAVKKTKEEIIATATEEQVEGILSNLLQTKDITELKALIEKGRKQRKEDPAIRKATQEKWKHVPKRKEYYKYVELVWGEKAMLIYLYEAGQVEIISGVTKTEYNTLTVQQKEEQDYFIFKVEEIENNKSLKEQDINELKKLIQKETTEKDEDKKESTGIVVSGWKQVKARKEIYRHNKLNNGKQGLIIFNLNAKDTNRVLVLEDTLRDAIKERKIRDIKGEKLIAVITDLAKVSDLAKVISKEDVEMLTKIAERVSKQEDEQEIEVPKSQNKNVEVVESKWIQVKSKQQIYRHTKLKEGNQGTIVFSIDPKEKEKIRIYQDALKPEVDEGKVEILAGLMNVQNIESSLSDVLSNQDISALAALRDKFIKETSDSKYGTEKEVVVFSNLLEVGTKVAEELLKGEVKLVFIKANGDRREMIATRNVEHFLNHDQLVQEFTELNTPANVGKEVNGGKINVVDLEVEGGAGKRGFVTERLLTYQPQGETIKEISILGDEGAGNHFDPTKKLDTAKMIEILGKKVVRLVFKKKDGSLRPMMATRNAELVKLYANLNKKGQLPKGRADQDSKEAIKTQIDRDYVKVLDLGIGEFRTFKPSTLKEYDSDLNIASWIEFAIGNDAWFNIAKNGKEPTQYYTEGKRNAVNIGRELSERTQYEQQRKMDLWNYEAAERDLEKAETRAQKIKEEREYQTRRGQNVKKIVHEEAMKVKDTPKSENFIKMYEEIKEIPTLLENDQTFKNMQNNIVQVKNFEDTYLTAIQIDRDVLYLHPTFIVNAVSGRVYVDRTSDQAFKDIGKVFESDADWGAEDLLEGYANTIAGFGKVRKTVFSEDESTIKRTERMITLAEKNRNQLSTLGIRVGKQTAPGGNVDVLGVAMPEGKYLIGPEMVLRIEDKKATVLLRITPSEAKGTEFGEFFSNWVSKTKSPAERERIKALETIVLTGLDLRRTV